MGERTKMGLVALATSVAAAAGCGDRITLVECPAGTQPQGARCVPWGADVGSAPQGEPDAGALPDFATADVVDRVGDLADGAGTSAAGSDATGGGAPDAYADASAAGDAGGAGGGTGSPCAKNDACAGGTCLDWPGGYCTRLDCDQSGCGGGELCLPFVGGNHLCMAGCVDDAGCRAGQACKALDDGAGGLAWACHGVADSAGSVGSACGTDDTLCAGAATCLQAMPGGYCAVEGCDGQSCPGGSECVKLGGLPTCLRSCDDDGDCDGAPGAERRCAILKAVAGGQVGACISGVEGEPVGGGCVNDFECSSASCQLLGEGQCSQTGAPCFGASEAEDCNVAEFCLITGQNQVGVCTQPCSVGASCPGASWCVGQPGVAEGWCRPSCAGPGASGECPAGGFTCTFGLPLGETSGQARYLCALEVGAGSVGSACDHPTDCDSGSCEIDGTGAGGTCVQPCTEDFYCPFPALCVPDAFPGTCRRACQSSADCLGGMTCGGFGAGLVDVCL